MSKIDKESLVKEIDCRIKTLQSAAKEFPINRSNFNAAVDALAEIKSFIDSMPYEL